MKINYNVSASIANKNLLGIESNLSKSMERLSSGFKINRAKDDPAGMAISNKMRAQIDGLDRASKNASDGISIMQIADGALSEVTSILQRMRELSVQAASHATIGLEDRRAIQSEIESLKVEIDRISRDTEYNTKTILDGSLDTRVYANNVSRVRISDYVKPGDYKLKIDQAATQAGPVTTTGKNFNDLTTQIGQSGVIEINGAGVEIKATDSLADVYEKIRNTAEVGDVTVKRDQGTGALSFISDIYGVNGEVKITFDNQALATSLGFGADANGNNIVHDAKNNVFVYGKDDGTGNIVSPRGTDPKLSNNAADWQGFTSSATYIFDGNRITITDAGGFSMSFLVEEGYAGDVAFEVADMGTMTLHIGANQDQNMQVRIPDMSTEGLYIDDVDLTTIKGAERGMTSLDRALGEVSAVRSRIGAYENRLDHATKSLDAFEENMTGAMSRLTDVDMADEMTNYTHQNILNQAAISVLTQANDLPQQVLQIMK